MNDRSATPSSVQLIDQFTLATQEGRVDDAQRLLDELGEHHPQVAARPVYATMLTIARGETLQALQNLPGDEAPELRAFCLFLLHDPTWEGLAQSLVDDSPDPAVRQSMRVLLGRQAVDEPA